MKFQVEYIGIGIVERVATNWQTLVTDLVRESGVDPISGKFSKPALTVTSVGNLSLEVGNAAYLIYKPGNEAGAPMLAN